MKCEKCNAKMITDKVIKRDGPFCPICDAGMGGMTLDVREFPVTRFNSADDVIEHNRIMKAKYHVGGPTDDEVREIWRKK